MFIHPQIQRVEIGQSASLKCVTSGGPIENLRWLRNGDVMKDASGAEFSLELLEIDDVTKESAAMYQCFVGNTVTLKQASGQLILTGILIFYYIYIYAVFFKFKNIINNFSCSA